MSVEEPVSSHPACYYNACVASTQAAALKAAFSINSCTADVTFAEMCMQGPAWGGIALGASPPGPGADAGPLEAKPRLSDIQAEQERVRDSCSRSFGAAGSSPSGDGFASLLHW